MIKQFPPKGYGPAMDRAVREASGDVVITLDCDDTYPVEVIPKLFSHGRRRGLGPGEHDARAPPPGRDAVAELHRQPRLRADGAGAPRRHTTDVHSGMRAYRKSMIDAVTWTPQGPALPVDMLVIPHRLGYRVADIPIEYRERIGETTLRRWTSTLWTFRRLWNARQIKRSEAPVGNGPGAN